MPLSRQPPTFVSNQMSFRLGTLLIAGTAITITLTVVGWLSARFVWHGMIHMGDGHIVSGAALGGIAGIALSLILGSLAAAGFRYNIRDVIWVTTVAALATGWLADHRELYRRAEQAEQDKFRNYYFIWDMGRKWAADVNHAVEFTAPGDPYPVIAEPTGEVRFKKPKDSN